MSNADYTVVVSAVLVSAEEAQIIEAVTASNFFLKKLPHALTTVRLDTTRSDDVTQCADTGN